LILGAVFIAAIAGLSWLDYHAALPGIWLMPLALLLSVLGAQEVLGLFAARDLRPSAPIVYGGNLLIVASNFVPVLLGNYGTNDWCFWAFALMVLAEFVDEMRRYTQPGDVMQRLALTTFSLAYIGLLLTADI